MSRTRLIKQNLIFGLKMPAFFLGLLWTSPPLYAIYHMTVGQQEVYQQKQKASTGRRENTEVALTRASTCSMAADDTTLLPTLTNSVYAAAEPDAFQNKAYCALDGTTAVARHVNSSSDLRVVGLAAVEKDQLGDYYKILISRGLIAEEHLPSFFKEELDDDNQ